MFVIGNFGGMSEANERDLSIVVDHDVLELDVVIGVASLVNLLNYRKELTAYMQNRV